MEPKTTTVEALIKSLLQYPAGTLVFLASDEEHNSIFGNVVVDDIEMEKSNSDGTFDAIILYPTADSLRDY